MFNVLLSVRHLEKQYIGMFHDSQTCLDSLILTHMPMEPNHQRKETRIGPASVVKSLTSTLFYSSIQSSWEKRCHSSHS